MSKAKTKASETTTRTSEHVAVRLTPPELARVDAEAARLRASVPGVSVTRSDTLRALITRGLDSPAAVSVKV